MGTNPGRITPRTQRLLDAGLEDLLRTGLAGGSRWRLVDVEGTVHSSHCPQAAGRGTPVSVTYAQLVASGCPWCVHRVAEQSSKSYRDVQIFTMLVDTWYTASRLTDPTTDQIDKLTAARNRAARQGAVYAKPVLDAIDRLDEQMERLRSTGPGGDDVLRELEAMWAREGILAVDRTPVLLTCPDTSELNGLGGTLAHQFTLEPGYLWLPRFAADAVVASIYASIGNQLGGKPVLRPTIAYATPCPDERTARLAITLMDSAGEPAAAVRSAIDALA